MTLTLKGIYCLLVLGAAAGVANAQQTGHGTMNVQQDRPNIRTEVVRIDLDTTQKLKSTQNVRQTEGGIQLIDPARKALLTTDPISVPLDSVSPFLAVGTRWIIMPTGEHNEHLRLEIRSSTDDKQWSEWKPIEKDEHLSAGKDTLVGALQYLPETTSYVQFKVELSVSDQQVEDFQLRSLLFSFTSPGATQPETLKKLEQQNRHRKERGKSEKGRKQQYPMPDYISRTGWDCPDGQEPSGTVTRTDVSHQIIHHSAGPNSSDDWPAVVRAIWDYHVNTNNWSDIGYNWLIDPNGIIYQGRGWINGDDEVQGAHFCGTNSGTMGACLLGNFEEVSPEPAALDAVEELLAWKSDQKNIDPLAQNYHPSSGLDLHTISGHRDGCSTLCPGENLYVKLPEIRNNVHSLIAQSVVAENAITSLGNYPNPFSEETTITFTLEEAGNVHITIWDLNGRLVEEVAQNFYAADSHQETWNASKYASGVYFCRVELERQYAVQKIVLVR